MMESAARPRRHGVGGGVARSTGGVAATWQRVCGGDDLVLAACRHRNGPDVHSARHTTRHPPRGRR